MSNAIEYVPGNSFMHRLDPRTKILFFLLVVCLITTVSDPIILGTIFAVTVLMFPLSQVPFHMLSNFLKSMKVILIIYIITNILARDLVDPSLKNVVFFYLLPGTRMFPITSQSLIYTIAMLFRFLTMVTSLRFITLITPIKDMILAGIKFKLPPSMGVALSIGLGFVPVLVNSITAIIEAQRSRAWGGLDRGNFLQRAKASLSIFRPILLHTMDRAGQIAIAIEARGFGYNIENRTYLRDIEFNRNDYVIFMVMALLLVGTLVLGYYDLLSIKNTMYVLGLI
jgi:energy-coupling factor transport system permease protein